MTVVSTGQTNLTRKEKQNGVGSYQTGLKGLRVRELYQSDKGLLCHINSDLAASRHNNPPNVQFPTKRR